MEGPLAEVHLALLKRTQDVTLGCSLAVRVCRKEQYQAKAATTACVQAIFALECGMLGHPTFSRPITIQDDLAHSKGLRLITTWLLPTDALVVHM